MSKEPTITNDEMKAILADVTAEVNSLLIKSEKDKLETLAKSNPGEEISSEPPADTTASRSAPESSGPEESNPAPEAPSGAPETAPGAPAPPDADPAQDVGPIDPMQLKAEYSQLPIEDLQAHYLAAKEALVEAMAAQQPAPVPGAAPVAASPAASPASAPAVAPAPTPEVPPVVKSEKDLRIEVLEKNEKEYGEQIEKLAQVMGNVLKAPLRKSIVSMQEVTKEGTKLAYKDMTKAQIDTALKNKISTGTLQKSDTDLIIGFDLGQVKIDQLAHLFV